MEAQEVKNEDVKEISKDDEEKLIMKTIEKIKDPGKQAKLLYLNKIADEREKIAENADKAQKDLINRYNIQYTNIYNKINDIVFGKNNNLDLTDVEKKNYNIIDSSDSNTNDIKNYWKTVLENADYFMFDDEDKKVLNYLNNIIYEDTENGFKVTFKFDENEYFEPNVLSKEYIYNNKNEISSIKATEINWKKEEFKNKKNIKQSKNKKDKKDKKDNKNKNNESNVDFSLFSIFKSIDNIAKKEKEEEKKGTINEELENELAIIDEEIDFFKNDLFKNQLEYYLNIMEIQEEDYDDEEYGEEDDYENDYYSNIHSNNNNRGRSYGRGQRRGRYNNYNNYNYNDYNDYNDYDNYDDYGYRNNNNYYGSRGNYSYNNYGGGRGYGRGGRGGRGRYNYYQRDYY